MSEEFYKSWNIKGIAESVLKEIREDGEELDDYLQRVYWSIYSREPDDARIVVELVKEFVGEVEEQTSRN
ncbi:MAG: hypothetical protein HW382_1229 [Deltaproteobacteria bacterium]|nr:hypothetical protein [Deltaproteobacteria bacterium]